MRFVVRRAKRGLLKRPQWTFRMIAENGEDIGGGETYNNRLDCEKAVSIVIFEAREASVEGPDA